MPSPAVDLTSAEFRADPYPVYRRLREEAPCFRLDHPGATGGMWLVTRYADVARVLRDPLLSKDLARVVPEGRLSPLDRAMISRDPPDHTRLRSLVGQAFTPRRVGELEPYVAAVTDALLDGFEGRVEVDFMEALARPLPVTVIAGMLGVPVEDHDRFGRWSGIYLRNADATRADAASRAAQREALRALDDYLGALIEERRRHPRDDLVSALLRARDRDDRLDEEELRGTCLLLLMAGHETTAQLLGNGLLALLRHPAQMERLRREPALLPAAVEEMLRFESPVQRATFRVTAAEVELAGRRVPRGEQVSAVVAAANRDPAEFPEPDRFDVARAPNRHLAFGLGPHYCLGAPLARLEARIAFGRILRRFPGLRPGAAEPEWSPTSLVRALRSLPVRP